MPTALHEQRADWLSTFAALTGHQHVVAVLPDGRLPDVLRVCDDRCSLFVGDAKDTETVGCTATEERLRTYVRSLESHLSRGRRGVFALCVDTPEWDDWAAMTRRIVLEHTRERSHRFSARHLGDGSSLLWVRFGPTSHDTPGQWRVDDERDKRSEARRAPGVAGLDDRVLRPDR